MPIWPDACKFSKTEIRLIRYRLIEAKMRRTLLAQLAGPNPAASTEEVRQ